MANQCISSCETSDMFKRPCKFPVNYNNIEISIRKDCRKNYT